jgi:hypothetical protein
MIYILTYVIIYGPPLLVGYLYYRHQKKKQEDAHRNNWLFRYLLPFIIFTVASLLWSGLLFGVAYFATQG